MNSTSVTAPAASNCPSWCAYDLLNRHATEFLERGRRIALRFTRHNPHLADDILSAASVQLLRNHERHTCVGLHRVVHAAGVSEIRKTRRSKEVPLDSVHHAVAQDESRDALALLRLCARIVERQLSLLPGHDVWMRHQGGVPIGRIAREYGRGEASVGEETASVQYANVILQHLLYVFMESGDVCMEKAEIREALYLFLDDEPKPIATRRRKGSERRFNRSINGLKSAGLVVELDAGLVELHHDFVTRISHDHAFEPRSWTPDEPEHVHRDSARHPDLR